MTVITVAVRTYSIMLPHGTRETDSARVSTAAAWSRTARTSSEVPIRAPRRRFLPAEAAGAVPVAAADSSSPGRSRTAVVAVFRLVRRTELALAAVPTEEIGRAHV